MNCDEKCPRCGAGGVTRYCLVCGWQKEEKPCPHCFDGMYPYYGLAPHGHVGVTDDPRTFIGSTVINPEPYPDNFTEDPDAKGLWGVYALPPLFREGMGE